MNTTVLLPFVHVSGGVLLCESTGSVFGPSLGFSGFILETGERVDLL
ncbi:MAG: hypothetical protein RI575_01580 [Balneolaceae bacterium]|nr:hypothetical protein [Balneolaceae bacterium]MDR9407782.1 hypothetical protein [Balneolaceae bacterium]